MTGGSLSLTEVSDLLLRAGFTPIETAVIPARAARYAPVPDGLHPKLSVELSAAYPDGLYSHQSESLREFLSGRDICLATPTASGKSLVFMTAAAEATMRDRFARVLALYPAKALIQDQLEKWERFLAPFGIRVGFIDGSVPVSGREKILNDCRVIAMTPDVAHAWLMSHTASRDVASALGRLSLLILDEAHVYDGAFGTNMAFFLRRLAVATSKPLRVIASTATIGDPAGFMMQLTGHAMSVFDVEADGSAAAEKTLVLTQSAGKGNFDKIVRLLVSLAESGKARFLAFGDSRKAVERIVAAAIRTTGADAGDANDDLEDGDAAEPSLPRLEHVLPFRAGYEAEDRRNIQKALASGNLAGVVSTSALELGLDIGDLDLVLLLNTPESTKAFRQRIGRAGRRREAVCVLIDDQSTMAPLGRYLSRTPEPGWLYLDNRYIQYSNALCAAAELQAQGIKTTSAVSFPGLPESFTRLVENELNPTEGVSGDLFELKQRAQGNPHYEFPIRTAAEQSFDVLGPFEKRLGTLSYSQALREAYPGAVYYYMARPYRVFAFEYKKGVVRVKRSRHFTTRPNQVTMAFPDFKTGVLSAWRVPTGFVAEVELQVNERVTGFVEQRGQTKTVHEYGPTSDYSQKPLTRFFSTTGVCWAFPGEVDRSESLGRLLLAAFSHACGVHERDLGLGLFHANEGPFEPTPVQGVAIYDATNGSLRLTERLAVRFEEVVGLAADEADTEVLKRQLVHLASLVRELRPVIQMPAGEAPTSEGDWVRLIARGEPAMHLTSDGAMEVRVLDFRYTPNGVMYELENNKNAKWMVLASSIQAIHGRTRLIRYNLVTGEELDDGSVALS